MAAARPLCHANRPLPKSFGHSNLGRTGLKVPRICLGCMTYGAPQWSEWVLDETASPIIGASKMHQIEEAVATLEIELSAEECTYLEQPYVPHPVLGHS